MEENNNIHYQKKKKTTWSKLGLLFVAIYSILTLICIIMALGPDNTSKSTSITLQIPVAVQIELVRSMKYMKYFKEFNWFQIYTFLWLPALIVVYYIGKGCEDFWRWFMKWSY